MSGEGFDEKREAELVASILADRRDHEAATARRRVGAYILGGYYLVTPAFFIVEKVYGLQLRVPAILAAPEQRHIYYGVCFLFGVLFLVLPRLAAWIAVLESTVNILLVMGGFAKAMSGVLTAAVEDPMGFDPSVSTVANQGIAGGIIAFVIWVFAFKCALFAAHREFKETEKDEGIYLP